MVKRRKSAKRRKTKSRFPLGVLFVPLIAISIFFVVRRESRKPRRETQRTARRGEGRHETPRSLVSTDPTALSRHFRLALKRAGGDDIWIKEPPASSPDSFDTIVTQGAYADVEQAAFHAAHAENLRIMEIDLPDHPAGMRAVRVTAYAGDKPVCMWTLREVPRIARVAIIVDDLGQNLNVARELMHLHASLTLSVMPRLLYSRATAEEAHREGIEVMLHLPMQPVVDSAPDVSAQELKVGMGSPRVDGIIQNSLESVPFAAGVNNHMGSRATTDPRLMREVMAELAARHLYYIDSRTISGSVALAVARRSGVPAFYRSVFLDDTKSVPYTLSQLRKLCRVAGRQGVALAIGHPYATTLAALSQFLPQLAREDIQLVKVSELLRQPEVARLAPSNPRRKERGRI